jgi:hypothetical protein
MNTNEQTNKQTNNAAEHAAATMRIPSTAAKGTVATANSLLLEQEGEAEGD